MALRCLGGSVAIGRACLNHGNGLSRGAGAGPSEEHTASARSCRGGDGRRQPQYPVERFVPAELCGDGGHSDPGRSGESEAAGFFRGVGYGGRGLSPARPGGGSGRRHERGGHTRDDAVDRVLLPAGVAGRSPHYACHAADAPFRFSLSRPYGHPRPCVTAARDGVRVARVGRDDVYRAGRPPCGKAPRCVVRDGPHRPCAGAGLLWRGSRMVRHAPERSSRKRRKSYSVKSNITPRFLDCHEVACDTDRVGCRAYLDGGPDWR